MQQGEKAIILKKGKEKPIRNKHHWIFSGAIESVPHEGNGKVFPVHSYEGQLLGSAYLNHKASIRARMLSFNATPPDIALKEALQEAIALRKRGIDQKKTNAFRLVNGEGDRLPGLIVDQYDKFLVLQFGTLGMQQLKEDIVAHLKRLVNPLGIYEKSILPSRKEEGLKDYQGWIGDKGEDEVEILENELLFKVSLSEGQKTGFFLDQREMRQKIKSLSHQKKVLNCFAYTGAFSVYAAAGGATQVDSIEISSKALEMAKVNMALNGFTSASNGYFEADVFTFLRESSLDYNLIVIDPPAFAKRQKDVVAACRGYKDINRIAFQKVNPGSFLLTCSCSYFVDETLFQQVIFQAAAEAGRKVKIIGRHQLAIDHPINIFHPEGDYLKSLLLYID